MATHSTIEWTDETWNPLVGCAMESPGCTHCYAERMSMRQSRMAEAKIRANKSPGRQEHYLHVMNANNHWNRTVEPVEEALDEPLHIRKPSLIFVNSMSDLFHKGVELSFIQRVFDVMIRADWHQFQILTKRSERLLELSPQLPWAPNIWQGVSVENADYRFRIDNLRQTGARIKFLSLEPLLGPMGVLDLHGIDWVIVGGESGPGARPMAADWVRDIRSQCLAARVPFFFKQWGNIRNNPDRLDPTAQKTEENKHPPKGGRTLDGVVWGEMPTLRPRT